MLTIGSARAWKSDSAAARSNACSRAQDLKTLRFPKNHRFGAPSASKRIERLGPALAPGFEHQNIPEQILPIAAAVEMLLPELANDLRIQQRGITQPLFVQQSLGPIAQRPTQPFAQRNAKSHLRPLDERAWHVPVQDLPQNPFCGVIPHLCIARQSPGKFHDAMIE